MAGYGNKQVTLCSASFDLKPNAKDREALLARIEQLNLFEWESFTDAVWSNDQFQALPSNLKEPKLAEPVVSFVTAINGIAGLTVMPRDFFVTGAQLYVNLIQFNIEQQGMAPPDCYTTRQLPRVSEEFLNFAGGQTKVSLAMSSLNEAIEFTPNAVNRCLTLMSTQLTAGWTAFEVLAGDLWEKAINIHPETLATKAAEALHDKSSVPFDILSTHKFNLHGVMGTVLRQARNNPFQGLDQIAETYQSTFPKGPNVSNRDFWRNKDVLATFLLRNVILHRAGEVDDEFAKKSQGDPRLARFEKGKPVRLDGALLSELLTGLVSFAEKLIRSVDNWMAANRVNRQADWSDCAK